MSFFRTRRLVVVGWSSFLLLSSCTHTKPKPLAFELSQSPSQETLEDWLFELNRQANRKLRGGAVISSAWQAWSSSERLGLAIEWWKKDKEALQLGVVSQLLNSVAQDPKASEREKFFSKWLLSLYSVNAEQLEQLAQAQAKNSILKEKIEALSSIEKNLEKRSR